MAFLGTPNRIASAALAVAMLAGFAPVAFAQEAGDESARTELGASSRPEADPDFELMYERFHATYKLGPEDEIAIRVAGEPDFTVERAKVSPFGAVYHPLLGDIKVRGLTVPETRELFAEELSEYIVKPRVSIALIEAKSARIGVLGDVTNPGIVVMERPLTVLDAIGEAGGFTTFGSKSNVTVLRQLGGGRTRAIEVDVKEILEAKAGPYANLTLHPGDTVIVHGNKKKTLAFLSSLASFGTFVTFLNGR